MHEERMALRVGEAAEALGISRSRVYELIAQGDIPKIKIGKSVRVPVEGLREWVARRQAAEHASSSPTGL